MESVDALSNSGLYFQAASEAAKSQVSSTDKTQKKEKTGKAKFSSVLEKNIAEANLREEGLPEEIAEMSQEEAVVYLRDAADIAADELRESQTPQKFSEYRKKVSQLLKFISRNNFEVIKHERKRLNRKKKPMDPQYEIRVINEELDYMARSFLLEHKAPLNMLAKVEEITGILVDLLAS